MRKSTNGFTIVELLIVIVVIGILAAITVVAYNGVQGRAHDAERASDIGAIKKTLEVYYVDHASYPNSNQMKDATFRKNTLNLPDSAATSPSGAPISYCWSSNVNQYCYVAGGRPNPPGGDCTGGSTAPYDITETCKWYTLSYRTEADPNTMISVSSLNH